MKAIQAQQTQQTNVANILYDAAKSRADAYESKATSTQPDTLSQRDGRTVHDTVTLSGEGQKIINLDRATQLAQTIKDAPLDKNFAQTLKQATDDIFRINKLFSKTLHALMSWFK